MKLNFPSYTFKFQELKQKKYIYDVVRKKFIPLTPEEWVRQHCIHYLHQEKGASLGLMQVEKTQVFNKLKLRFDVALYGRNGQPLCIVECKRPEVKLTKETLIQTARYYSGLNAKYIWLTNGINHVWFSREEGKLKLLDNVPEKLTSS